MQEPHAGPLLTRIAAFQGFPVFDDTETAADVISSDLL
jgi:hypothetical protein